MDSNKIDKQPDQPQPEARGSFNPKEAEPLADGTHLVYNRERSGEVIPNLGLILEPGYYVTVGKDVSGADAAALVNLGTLRKYDPEPEPEEEPQPERKAEAERKPESAQPSLLANSHIGQPVTELLHNGSFEASGDETP